MKRITTSRIVGALALILTIFVVYSVAFRGGNENPRIEYNLAEYLERIDDGEVEAILEL